MVTTPSNFAVGERITAAKLNEDKAAIRELQSSLGRVGITMRIPANLTTVSNTLYTPTTWAPEGGVDPYGFANTAAEPIKIPTGYAGLYLVQIAIQTTATASTRGLIQASYNLDALGIDRETFTGDVSATGLFAMPLAAGDTIRWQCLTNPALTILASGTTELSAYRVAL